VNGLPDPYPNGTHVVVRGRTLVITDHAPNADDWHYHGTPADLAGDVVTFSHREALPVRRVTSADSAYAQELADLQAENVEPNLTPLEELLSVVEHIARRGHVELRQALNIYRETAS
jgi:hypothetical protein